MGENCFAEVQYSIWFLSLIARLRVVWVPGFKTFQLPSELFCRSTRIRARFKTSFSVGTKVVFFGVLRFLSRVDAFSGIKIATDWNSISCYVATSNNTILLCMLSTNEGKLILSCCHRCFLWLKFSEDKHWHSFMPPVFLFQRLWFFRRFYWRNVCPRWPPFQFPDQRVKGIIRTSGEIDFRFRLELKITLVESTYPSQRPQCPSLSPHFLLSLPISRTGA